eukprot:gene1684-2337_t
MIEAERNNSIAQLPMHINLLLIVPSEISNSDLVVSAEELQEEATEHLVSALSRSESGQDLEERTLAPMLMEVTSALHTPTGCGADYVGSWPCGLGKEEIWREADDRLLDDWLWQTAPITSSFGGNYTLVLVDAEGPGPIGKEPELVLGKG